MTSTSDSLKIGQPVQPTLPTALEKVKIWDINHPKAQELTISIAEMIAVDNQPIRTLAFKGS